jgi:hypothetical protein
LNTLFLNTLLLQSRAAPERAFFERSGITELLRTGF